MTSPEHPRPTESSKPSSALDVFERIVENSAKTWRTALLLVVAGLPLVCALALSVYLIQLQPLLSFLASVSTVTAWFLRKLSKSRRRHTE
jgi:Flp pilus assembly protein TadB